MSPVARKVVEIRAFHLERDAFWLHQLWHRTMHARWALSLRSMQSVLSNARLLLVAERGGFRIGFCAADYERAGDAGLLALLVEPRYQRDRVGSALLLQLESMLRVNRVGTLHLGAFSTGTYFWPGMPAECDSAQPFFARNGWQQREPCADLVQELDSFQTPTWVSDRLGDVKIFSDLTDSHLRTQVSHFERVNFPAWASFVESELMNRGEDNLLVAQTSAGSVVGTLLVKTAIRNLWADDITIRVGSLNILGVAAGHQRQGIGLALAARAMEVLRARGCSRCYIQWTGLNDWYGKLGATVWAQYRMASKAL